MKTLYTLGEIQSIVGGKLYGEASSPIGLFLHDSRKAFRTQGALFVALGSAKNDGHRYLAGLRDKGVRDFLVSQAEAVQDDGANYLLVPSTLEALQALAAHHRARFGFPVLGITGSNGKTVVKEWLHQLLHPSLRVARSPKSYNSQLGVALSLLQIDPDGGWDLALIEAGISRPGEMERLERMVRPDWGIFTLLGTAHQENFESLEQKRAEKWRLFASCPRGLAPESLAGPEGVLWWGRSPLAPWRLLESRETPLGTLLRARTPDGQERALEIPFRGQAATDNAMLCWMFCHALGLPHEPLRERAARLENVPMRLEIKDGANGCKIINDGYNSDLESIGIALDELARHAEPRAKWLVLSDLMQQSAREDELYAALAARVNSHGLDRLLLVGPALARNAWRFRPAPEAFADTPALLEALPRLRPREATVLVKGARPFAFERLVRALERKNHRTVLEIDMGALLHNFNTFRALVGPGVRLMGMVKAFSYGSGSVEVARLLEYHRVDYLGVAFADEGVELRQAGIRAPIMVMSPSPDDFETLLEHGLEPEIHSLSALEAFARAAARAGEGPARLHLKLETGMRRLGIDPGQDGQAAELLRRWPQLELASCFTHLAATDEPRHDAFTLGQIGQFEARAAGFREALGQGFLLHCLNSAGIERFPQARFDMVRLGIGLYGIGQDPALGLLPISKLRSRVSQVRELLPGQTVGYGRAGSSDRPTRVATIAIGYADGYSRAFGNGVGKVWIKGSLHPTIGRVCMDMCMVDVGQHPVEEGDEVVLFGPELPVSEVAALVGTIPYEVMTSVSQRVKKVYFLE